MASSSPTAVIAVLGSLNIDLVTRTPRIPSAGETLTAHSFETHHGGKGANQAVACARLSRPRPAAAAASTTSTPADPSSSPSAIQVRMIGAVGADDFSPPLLAALRADGLDVSRVRTVAGEMTGVATIVVEERTGENRIMVAAGANGRVEEGWGAWEGDEAVAVMQLEVPVGVVVRGVREARGRGVDVLLNPAPAVPLPDEVYEGLGHLVMNESEAALLAGKKAEEITAESDLTAVAAGFIRKGVENVVITLGSAGVFYHTAARQAECLAGKLVAAKKVQVVDTTAAGDTFVGAYAVAVARSRGQITKGAFDIDAAMAFANRAAAQTVQRKGAQSSIPWLDEVPEA